MVEAPEGSGSTNPEAGNHTYTQGANIQAEATPKPNWVFGYWLLDGSKESTNPVTVVMDASHILKPIFTEVQYNLTITVEGSGSTNPTPGTHTYANGTKVTVNATASEGWQFQCWTTNNENTTDNPNNGKRNPRHRAEGNIHTDPNAATVIPVTNRHAHPLLILHPHRGTVGQGSVARNPATPTRRLKRPTHRTPATGYTFMGGAATPPAQQPTHLSMTRKTVTGHLHQEPVQVTVNSSGQGTAKNPNLSNYTYGGAVQPHRPGWIFAGGVVPLRDQQPAHDYR